MADIVPSTAATSEEGKGAEEEEGREGSVERPPAPSSATVSLWTEKEAVRLGRCVGVGVVECGGGEAAERAQE